MNQYFIFFLSTVALFLITRATLEIRRWGSIVGLIGQWFWIVETLKQNQWGMFALSIIYVAIYAQAAWRDFRAQSSPRQ